MATTISTINQSLVDQKVVAALRYMMPFLKTFSYQVTATGMIQSDVMYVPIATDPTAQSKTAGTTPTANGTVAGTSVTLSNFYAASWDATEGKIAGNLFENYWADKAAGGVYALAKQVIDATLGQLTTANFGHATADQLVCPTADFGQANLAQLWKLAEDKIRQREKSLGLNAAYAAALFGQSTLALTYATGGNNFFSSGVVPQILGMPTWVYTAFPACGQNVGGAVIGRASLLLAAAPPSPLMSAGEGGIIDRRIITDPESGLSVLYTMKGEGGGTVTGEVELLYGVAVGQDAAVRLRTEDNG
jgi:hypothetical protein